MRKIIYLMTMLCVVVGAWSDPSDIVWEDDTTNNPVIVAPGLTDANRAYYATVIFDPYANIWRAWFDTSSGMDVAYGESSDADGINWGNYALCNGFTNSFKQSKPFVIQLDENLFRMWYTADDRGGGYFINTCTSTDGINWTNDEWVVGIAEPDASTYGPTERFTAVRLDDGSLVAYVRCEEPDIEDALEGKRLSRYTSTDGVNWTWSNDTLVNDIEGLESMEFSSVVKHPDKDGVWYAWGNPANSEGPFQSFVSTDDGLTFELDENPVATIGEIGTQSFNQDRNYHPSATYMGNGQWVMYRSVAEPKATARAIGVEEIETPISNWSLY